MIEDIKTILEDKYRWPTTVELELNDESSGMQISIQETPDNGLVIEIPERAKAHLGIVRQLGKCKTSCDYVILVPQNERTEVYFVEMKKTIRFDKQGVPNEACGQIIHTIPIIEYLIKMAEAHFSRTQEVDRYYVIIGEKTNKVLDKQGVRPRMPEVKSFKNRQFKIIYSPTIRFSQLK